MSKTIERKTGDSKPLRWVVYAHKSTDPEILTGHSFSLEITDSGDTTTPVSGNLYLGDCGVYFDVPAGIYDVAGTYTYKLLDTDAAADVLAIDSGTLIYA